MRRVLNRKTVHRDSLGRRMPIDEAGSVYGKLTVIRQGERKLKKDGRPDDNAVWVCQCACGNTALIRGNSLRSGNSTSCGCTRRDAFKPKTLPKGQAAARRALLVMKANARNRGFTWDIDDRDAISLMSRSCFYCDVPPSNLSRNAGGNGSCVYSGLDRLDSSKGYFKDNVVPCCINCNQAKWTMSPGEFRAWLSRAYNHFVLGGKS